MEQGTPRAGTAAYKRIEGSLRGRIGQGQWPAGSMLPGRRNLAREYGVSVMTIERAITQLVADGMLRADDRRGTFVTERARMAAVPAGAPVVLRHRDEGAADRGPEAIRPRATGTVGLIASLYLYRRDHLELHNFWTRLMLQALERCFSDAGRRTFFFNRAGAPGEPPAPLGEAVQAVQNEGVEAIAVIGFGLEPREVDRGLDRVGDSGLPMVCITSGELRRPVPHVFYDNYSAGYQAAQHLLAQGERDIVFLAPFLASWVRERLDGVQAAVELAHLPAETVRVFPRRSGSWVQEEDPQVIGAEAARDMLAEGIRPSSLIGINDGVALGALETLGRAGLRAGRDFSIIGFDDHPDARSAGLTTMRPPMENMGEEAGRLLQRALRGEDASLQVRLRWHLVPRASTRTPGQDARPQNADAVTA